MAAFKETLKQVLPPGVTAALKNGRDSLQRLPDDIQAQTHPWRREINQRLRLMRNRYQGKRCFVIGTAPACATRI